MEWLVVLVSPILVMLVASRLVDFNRRWPSRVSVVLAAGFTVILAIALTQGMAFWISPLIGLYALMVGGVTYGIVKPR